jgi:hypothetical protein
MVLIGNANPENVTAGIRKKKAVTIACCCVAETVEISRPTPNMQSRKRIAPITRTETCPRNGTWNQRVPTTAIKETSNRPIRKNGRVFPRMNSPDRIGVTMMVGCDSCHRFSDRTTSTIENGGLL